MPPRFIPPPRLTLWLALLGALVLTTESFLGLRGSSLCQSQACEVVGQSLKVPESLLVALGAGLLWCLALFTFLGRRYPRQLRLAPLLLLIPALLFDGGLIGYQLFTLQERCTLCLATAGLLLLLTTITCLGQRLFLLLVVTLLAWGATFAHHGLLKPPPPTSAASEMLFYSAPPAADVDNTTHAPSATLIFSMHCDHCLDIIALLAQSPPHNYSWHLATIDQDSEALGRLSRFMAQANNSANPFDLLQESKQTQGPADTNIPHDLTRSGPAARRYLHNLGLDSIPVLVLQQEPDRQEILVGSTNILEALGLTTHQPLTTP